MVAVPHPPSSPGVALARGVCRFLIDQGFAPVAEFTPARGLRTDVCALGPRGEVWTVECKSSLADFRSDAKWTGYLNWCDAFFFAVDAEFPVDVLPPEHGLIVADAYGAEILRDGALAPLAPARRKALSLRFARAAAARLRRELDPGVAALDLD